MALMKPTTVKVEPINSYSLWSAKFFFNVFQLLSWIRKVGEETLNSQIVSLRMTTDAAGVKTIEKSFENFYFNALVNTCILTPIFTSNCFILLQRQIDKASDLVEEANNIKDVKGQSLKESSKNLKIQIKLFSERLEEIRERLEDTSRCYLLLESCQDILVDDNKEREDFKKLAFRSGNEKLVHLCKVSFISSIIVKINSIFLLITECN